MRKPAPSEVPSLRTTYSDTYDNHDGTFTSSISAAPINYRPSAGAAFAPIDLTFSAISGGNGRVRAGKTVMPVEVGAPDDAAGFMSLDTGSGKISLRLAPGTKAGIAGSRPSSKGPVSSVSGLMAGMDLSVSAGRSGVRTFFTLKSKPASNSFTVALDAGKLNPVFNADGSISFLDAKGKAVATMPHPYAVDSSYDEHLGSGQMTSDVGYSLSTQGSTTLLTVVRRSCMARVCRLPRVCGSDLQLLRRHNDRQLRFLQVPHDGVPVLPATGFARILGTMARTRPHAQHHVPPERLHQVQPELNSDFHDQFREPADLPVLAVPSTARL